MLIFLKPLLLIFTTTSFLFLDTHTIEPGLYIAKKGGVITKYAILEVQGDSATFESFIMWQGQWVPAIGTWDENYTSQKLVIDSMGNYSNENVLIYSKKNFIKGKISNSTAGKRFVFQKVDSLPESYKNIKLKSEEFCIQNIKNEE